jgi:DNA polymerase-3 subunit alpha
MPDFVHLHTHSDFSLLDGAASIEDLVARAKACGMKSLALTDHGNMFGSLRFYKECLKEGIKPIIGCEAYVAPDSRHNRTGGEKGGRYHHLGLLARDVTGYLNLLKLCSLAYTEGFYYKPRIDDELLARYHEGLTALSGCMGGEIPSLILRGETEKARARALFMRELFGPEGFYLEVHNHGIPEQAAINQGLAEISRSTGIALAAANDVHYATREDAAAQDILLCIGMNKKVSEGQRLKFAYPEFYFKSGEEMLRALPELPQALESTVRIAEACSLEIPLPAAAPALPGAGGLHPGQLPGGGGPQGPGAALLAAHPGDPPAPGLRAGSHQRHGLHRLLPDRLGLHPLRQGAGDPRGGGEGLRGGVPGGLRPADHGHRS